MNRYKGDKFSLYEIFKTLTLLFISFAIFMVMTFNSKPTISIDELQKENLDLKLQIIQLEDTIVKIENEKLNKKILIENYKINNEFEVTITAYTARKQETNNDPNNTAIMETPMPGQSIAVSRDLQFMLGKRVYIPGYGVRRVNDLMNSRYEKSIDILVSSVSEARKIGKKKGYIILIEPELLIEEFLENS